MPVTLNNSSSEESLADALKRAVGLKIDHVEFVEDYVQIRFGAGRISAYTLPNVRTGDGLSVPSDSDYRQILGRLVDAQIVGASVNEEMLVLAVDNGSSVSISLLDDDYNCPEALEFTLGERRWVA